MAREYPYADRLLEFYRASGRVLPWRGDKDPYHIWISEIMLQQTGVTSVCRYYERFLERFPTVARLAQADLQEVLGAWQGMGYYRRAQHLHRAAVIIQDGLKGQWPETLEGWLALPGIGRSTAGAIMAICWNRRHPILDGNCKRVLSRIMALNEPVNSSQATRMLWHWADLLTPPEQPGDYAQAIMDLGAVVCTLRDPKCNICPWQGGCRAFAESRVGEYPNRMKAKVRPRYGQQAILVQESTGAVLMRRRPEGGLLGGMWEPLSTPRQTPPQPPSDVVEMQDQLERHWQVHGCDMKRLGRVQHAFTHFHLTVWVYSCRYVSGWPQGAGEEICWWDAGHSDMPVSTLHAKVLAMAGQEVIN
ncbi:MAG: A/G-specific adenine glycosylase [Magnetococcales bacterium]|nr:A/G-specific adenine glycosylase [Magnetococcales bacterium]